MYIVIIPYLVSDVWVSSDVCNDAGDVYYVISQVHA